MIMMCNLLAQLEQKRSLAKARCEKAEINRLDGLIRFHREKCLVCAGMEHTTLVEKFFNRKVIVVKDKSA